MDLTLYRGRVGAGFSSIDWRARRRIFHGAAAGPQEAEGERRGEKPVLQARALLVVGVGVVPFELLR